MIFDLDYKNDIVSCQPKQAYLEFAWDDLREAEKSSPSPPTHFKKMKSNPLLITGPESAR